MAVEEVTPPLDPGSEVAVLVMRRMRCDRTFLCSFLERTKVSAGHQSGISCPGRPPRDG